MLVYNIVSQIPQKSGLLWTQTASPWRLMDLLRLLSVSTELHQALPGHQWLPLALKLPQYKWMDDAIMDVISMEYLYII
jgi:hypothetical protein